MTETGIGIDARRESGGRGRTLRHLRQPSPYGSINPRMLSERISPLWNISHLAGIHQPIAELTLQRIVGDSNIFLTASPTGPKPLAQSQVL